MKNPISRAMLLFTALAMFAAACGGTSESGTIEIENARFRVASSDLAAGYLTISNTTSSDVTLQGATAEGVGRIEMHESMLGDDGLMAMQARPDGFVIAAGETVNLEPGGKHLMIFEPGTTEDMTISFDFGDETIDVVAAFDEAASAAVDNTDHADHGGDEDHADHGGDEDNADHGDDEDHADHRDDAMDDEAMEAMDDETMDDDAMADTDS